MWGALPEWERRSAHSIVHPALRISGFFISTSRIQRASRRHRDIFSTILSLLQLLGSGPARLASMCLIHHKLCFRWLHIQQRQPSLCSRCQTPSSKALRSHGLHRATPVWIMTLFYNISVFLSKIFSRKDMPFKGLCSLKQKRMN